ncbi:MAG: hypothetical protein K0Q59_5812, partial [Paenibacillus sp.]|nr:hypothetical protein [Paenibacillus sp.]
SFLDKGELVRALRGQLNRSDAVLLKGSRGMQLETIVQDLMQAK